MYYQVIALEMVTGATETVIAMLLVDYLNLHSYSQLLWMLFLTKL